MAQYHDWTKKKEKEKKTKKKKVRRKKRSPSPEDPQSSGKRKRIEAARQYEEDLAKLEDFRKRSRDARQSKAYLKCELTELEFEREQIAREIPSPGELQRLHEDLAALDRRLAIHKKILDETAADIRFYNDGVRMYEARTKDAPPTEEEVDSQATGQKPKQGWRRNVLKPIN